MPAIFLRFFLFLLLVLLPPASFAAASGGGASLAVNEAGLKQLDALREKVEKDTRLPEEKKKAVLSVYDEAADWLARARSHQERARQFTRQRAEAPRTTASIRKALAAGLKEKPLDLERLRKQPLPELIQLVETEKANLASRDARVAELEQKLAGDAQRPEAARKRLAEAKQELEGLQKALESRPKEPDPLERARHWRDMAHALALQSEIRMLEQELLTLPSRRALDEAKYEEAKARRKLAEARVEQLEELLNQRRRKEVEKLSRAEEATQQAVAGKNPLLEQVAAENAALGDQLALALRELEETSRKDNKLKERAKWLQEMYRTTREKVKVAGIGGALGQVLLEQRSQLPDLRRLRRELADIHKRITDTTLRQIRHREALRSLSGEALPWPKDLSARERKRLEPQLKKLLERKRELLGRLVSLDNEQLKALAELDVAMQELYNAVQEFDAYLAEHLLWVRNTQSLRLGDLARLPGELRALFDPAPWLEVWKELLERVSRSPLAQAGLVVLLLISLFSRRLPERIRATAPGSKKPGRTNFLDTVRALLLSLLLPLWLLFWLGFLYWLLRTDGGVSDYGDAMVMALKWSLPIFYSILAARALTLRGGLLQAHFRWTAATVAKLRRALDYLLWLFIPASVITSIAIHVLPDGLGSVTVKLAFVVLAGTMSLFIYQVLHPTRGIIASYLRANPGGYLSRLRWLWFFAVVAIPLVLMGLSLAGYVYSAATILRHLVDVLWLIGILVLVQQLAESWLLLTRRRLAYKAALARRQELAEKEAAEEAGSGSAAEPEREAREEAAKVDLAALSKESRKLLNALLFIGGAVGVWLIWSPLIPALAVLDDIALWQQTVTVEGHQERVAVTVGDVLSVLAIVVLTVLAARNLPSLIEILLLQYFHISAGSRYTIRTLAGYVIAAVGMVALFRAVGGTWDSIQWLVAALGVGIGFGLQEIVANFISGLIILFERPIRVGDFVTVGDTDGTVTRIRIRATTILTRDRKELLVPNKEFITGRLLNWTLSDSTTRLKVVVGIRYGADVALAEKIMLEAAREHPRVLPEPAPWVNFNDFGDSALLLELRCIVESADIRVQVASELRHAIDRGFRAAEMEIPFPQRDVHLDTLGPLEVRIQPQE